MSYNDDISNLFRRFGATQTTITSSRPRSTMRQRQCGCSAGSGHAQSGGVLQRGTGSFCHGTTSFERNGHSVPLIGFCRCHGLRLTRVPDAFFARLYAGLRPGETAVA